MPKCLERVSAFPRNMEFICFVHLFTKARFSFCRVPLHVQDGEVRTVRTQHPCDPGHGLDCHRDGDQGQPAHRCSRSER